MNNPDGINLDLCLGRKENPLFSSPSSYSGVDPSLCKYDVFISFRGGDAGHSFTSHLYSALCRNQINAYIDEDRLEKGDDVSRALPKAIEESAISIIIFSTNYASSTWCLDELVHILKCQKVRGQIVVPIFHGVDPSDIRKLKRSYADAFGEHQQRFKNAIDKVQEWRQALKEASGLSGWDSRVKSEADIVETVVKDLKEKLKLNVCIEDLLQRLKTKLRSANMVLNDAEEKQLDDLNAKCLRTFLPLGDFLIHSDQSMVPPLKLLMEEGCLRVLSLYNCWIAQFPDSIGNLKHLRYLDVSYTSIKEVPNTICTLYNLETLLLKKCRKLTRLPTDIGRLTKLAHLDFSRSSIKELPLQIFDMKDLQTLQPKFILQKEHADSSIKKLGAFQQLHGEVRIEGLENVVDVKNVCEAKLRDKKFITELGLHWDGSSDDSIEERVILDQLQPHTNLKELYIEGYSGTMFSDWMGDQSFSSIVKVELFNCENSRSLRPLDQLPSLKTLMIGESFWRVETINWEFFSKPFRSLEVLHFRGMLSLKEWLFREGEVVFPTLKELKLSHCPKLEVQLLPDCFPSLTRLEVSFCRQLMPFKSPATQRGSIFPSLQKLEIENCPEQESILEGELPSRLEIITIRRCHNLKALDDNCFRHLTSLRKLKIEECNEELQCLPQLPSYPFDLVIIRCPFLTSRCQENGEDWHKIKHAHLKLI